MKLRIIPTVELFKLIGKATSIYGKPVTLIKYDEKDNPHPFTILIDHTEEAQVALQFIDHYLKYIGAHASCVVHLVNHR